MAIAALLSTHLRGVIIEAELTK